jgi:RNA polymerase sigma-70 factor (ECF subfamily)
VGVSTAYAQAPPRDTTALLYERHSSRIFGFCLSRLGSREDAEDALQMTFLNAQRGLGRGVVPEYELAWLFKIAQNVCHNRHQSAKRRGRVEAPHDLDSLQDVIASPERGGSGVSLGDLTQALGTVPSRQRKALLLREFQGYSYEEIAAELDVTVAAVETLLFRARRAVAQQLEQTGTTQSRGRSAVAVVFEVFQWLFKGGAAPLKLAAVAATVATTASLAVVPAIRDGRPAAPPLQKLPVFSSVVPQRGQERSRAVTEIPHRAASRPQAAGNVTATSTPTVPVGAAAPLQTSQAPASKPVARAADAAAPTLTTAAPTVTAPVVPGITVPEVTVPAVSLPDVQLPEVKLPAVQLPTVQLPAVQLPAVQLPKLP